MSKTIELPKHTIKFPPVCVVCEAPAVKNAFVDKLFVYRNVWGNRTSEFSKSIHVQIAVPMCGLHYQDLNEESPLEHFIHSKSMFLAVLFGLLGALVVLWNILVVFEEPFFLGILVAILVGIGLFNLFTACTPILASFFALPATKEARKAVRLKSYSAGDHLLRIRFENEQVAEMVTRANKEHHHP
jgi:hypothetical protein